MRLCVSCGIQGFRRYRHGFIGVGRMEAKVVSVCLDFQAVSLISKSQSSPLKADEFEID